ncbi:MAG: MotA/TolQ/ExbB proton channel family protein [Opitutales bacterium]
MSDVIQLFQDGGPLMWILLACSLIAVAVIVERAVRLRRRALIDTKVVEDIQTHVEQGKIDMAIARHHGSPSLVGRILSKGLDEYTNTSADIETSLVEAGERGLQVLNNNLSVLGLIARVAPLLGLLGTVIGMIAGFGTLEIAGVGKEELAKAIRMALITTASGLAIAIPTIIASTYFRSRIRRITAEFEEIFIDLIKTVKAANGDDGSSDSASEEQPAKKS